MMWFLVFCVVVLLLFVLSLGWLVIVLVNRVEQLQGDAVAHEQGFDEVVDSYEQQFLSFREMLEADAKIINRYEEENAELQAHLDKHDRECLPNSYDASWRPHVTAPEDVDPPLFQG